MSDGTALASRQQRAAWNGCSAGCRVSSCTARALTSKWVCVFTTATEPLAAQCPEAENATRAL